MTKKSTQFCHLHIPAEAWTEAKVLGLRSGKLAREVAGEAILQFIQLRKSPAWAKLQQAAERSGLTEDAALLRLLSGFKRLEADAQDELLRK